MKQFFKKYTLAFILWISISVTTSAQNTTIWIVRHAEKDTSAANKRDPELTEIGKQRALDLAAFLKGQEPDMIFSTNTKRTRQTAAHFKAKVNTYDPSLIKEFAQRIIDFQKGKKILIVGHSNTVLETIEALGGSRPVAQLVDDDYDYIFKVSLTAEGGVVTKFYHYGAKHHIELIN
jgi:broad specificity phosphatase PhoE